jgi:hypothetical protein
LKTNNEGEAIASRKSSSRVQRMLWSAVIFPVLSGVAIVMWGMLHLIPMLINGYRSPAAPSTLVVAQLLALDDLFAHYPALTLVHILPALVFLPF